MKKITMETSAWLSTLAALRALDGYQKMVRENGADRAVNVPYVFSAATRLALAENMVRIESLEKAFRLVANGARERLQRKGKPAAGADDLSDADLVAQVEAEMQGAYSLEREIEVTPLARGQLNLDENPIPPSILRHLMPLLDAA